MLYTKFSLRDLPRFIDPYSDIEFKFCFTLEHTLCVVNRILDEMDGWMDR